jgi:pimeloyl-ACP methyl ester carboxylesterase
MRIGPGYDWERRSPRWAGITSEVGDIGGTRMIGPLSGNGVVIALDLPGSGRSRPIRRGAGATFAAAEFLDDFTTALGLERLVVHGHSLGGLVGAMFATQVPDRVERLVLTSAPLPGPPDPPPFPAAWRIGFAMARPVVDVLVGAGIRLKADAWRRWVEERDSARLGSELSRMSTELLAAMRLGFGGHEETKV